MKESDEELLNEKSYETMLLGEKKDKTKDPRYKAVKGLSIKIGMTVGVLERLKKMERTDDINKLIDACDFIIPILADQKERLKRQIFEKTK